MTAHEEVRDADDNRANDQEWHRMRPNTGTHVSSFRRRFIRRCLDADDGLKAWSQRRRSRKRIGSQVSTAIGTGAAMRNVPIGIGRSLHVPCEDNDRNREGVQREGSPITGRPSGVTSVQEMFDGTPRNGIDAVAQRGLMIGDIVPGGLQTPGGAPCLHADQSGMHIRQRGRRITRHVQCMWWR
ncbi:hypothetical protein FIBSPDRAFT_890853 [Athelia psychrophila]|uniref:Uncharacterized protein n=1 Tax=Athelia psychrophila TaxID=1759441 RepID=A0A166KF82_9AGAM|nr:hypothetical protein FIBSPDRAFT_890853 [Fibularhizoctonia sp. CBS 109695]